MPSRINNFSLKKLLCDSYLLINVKGVITCHICSRFNARLHSTMLNVE